MSSIFGLIFALADIAPDEPLRTRPVGDLGMLVGALACGAAVVTAATLFIWRRSGRGLNSFDGEASAGRQAALGSAALALGIAWIWVVTLAIVGILLLGSSRTMGTLALLSIIVICPLLGATGTVLGGLALASKSQTTRPRGWRALAGIAINVPPLLIGLLILCELFWRKGCIFC